MKFTTALLLCIVTSVLSAQGISVTTTVTDATCSTNGRLEVAVSGGRGDYRYLLLGGCGETFPPQNEAIFETLAPCTYELVVTDRITGARSTTEFELQAVNGPLSVTTDFTRCDGQIEARGGATPYTISYTVGDDPPVMVTSETGLVGVGTLGDDKLIGRVTDQCGNSRDFELDGRTTAVRAYDATQTATGITLTARNGLGPFTYTITSDAGSFTNATGVFPSAQVGCNFQVSIIGSCGNRPLVRDRAFVGKLGLDCVNFNEGTVTLSVSPPGVTPYSVVVEADGVRIESDDLFVTGIPPGTQQLDISARDGCGNALKGAIQTTANRINLLEDTDDCEDERLTLNVARGCFGEVATPITVNCSTCRDTGPYVQRNARSAVRINQGTRPGNYVLTVADDCGDRFTCRDTVQLELLPACGSINANLIQRFLCENGTDSRRLILDPSIRYSAFDAGGGLIEEGNTTGIFSGLAPGTYRVEATSTCLSASAEIIIPDSRPVDPVVTVRPQFRRLDGGGCRLVYEVTIDRTDGPYELERLDGTTIPVAPTDAGVPACASLEIPSDLAPGDYRLTSQRLCGEKLFTLPDLMEERIDSITPLRVCQNSVSVSVAGLRRTKADWVEYFEGFGLQATIRGGEDDIYRVDGERFSSDVLDDLVPGTYTLEIAFGFAKSNCAVDTMTFTVPEYQPVDLVTEGNFICTSTGEAPLALSPRAGTAPYEIRLIDCENPSRVLESYELAAGETVQTPTSRLGMYCYIVQDDCGITADFQVEVRTLADALRINYNCSPAVELFTDSLGGSFTWSASDGSVISNSTGIVVPESLQDRNYTLEVSFGSCVETETVNVPGRSILPRLTMVVDTIVKCESDTIVLPATADSFSLLQLPGAAAGAGLRVTEPGTYTVEATNDLGCTVTDDITVVDSPSPNPTIAITSRSCPGEPATLEVLRGTGEVLTWAPGNTNLESLRVTQSGQYIITAINEDGCVGRDSFAYTAPGPLAFAVQVDSVTCFNAGDGAVLLNGTGGTGELSYSFRDQVLENGSLVSGVAAGTYGLTLTDANDCMRDTTVTVDQSDSIYLDLGPDQFIGLGRGTSVPITSNIDGYGQITSNPPAPDSILRSGLLPLSLVSTTLVTVTATDLNGCAVTDEVVIGVDAALRMYTPTAFSPNGDGVNDRFTLFGPADGVISIGTLKVYDRWGALVYEDTDSNELSGGGWDGRNAGGRILPAGTYFWYATIVLSDGSVRELSGEVTLIR